MKLVYHKQIVNMLYQEWDLGKTKSKAKGKVCAYIYWFKILSEAEKIFIEKDRDKVVGVCGYTKWESNKYLLRKKIYNFLSNLLIYSPLVKNRQAIEEYNCAYNYIPEELDNYFDGELTILIVDKMYRGKSIGKKLLSKTFDFAKEDNMRNIQISSDESCNYKFYENFNCVKVYENVIKNGELFSEKNFIYEKKFR